MPPATNQENCQAQKSSAPIVQCSVCSTIYDKFVYDEEQADGCAAKIRKDFSISGYYGSTLADMTTYKFVSAHAQLESGILNPGMICDNCIQELLDRKLIERDPENSIM